MGAVQPRDFFTDDVQMRLLLDLLRRNQPQQESNPRFEAFKREIEAIGADPLSQPAFGMSEHYLERPSVPISPRTTPFGVPGIPPLAQGGQDDLSSPLPQPPSGMPWWGDAARSAARGLSGIEMAEQAGVNLAQAQEAGDPLRGAAAVGQGGLAALPFAGPAARAAFATAPRAMSTGAAFGAVPLAAGGFFSPSAEAQQAQPPDDGLTAEQRARRAVLNKQQQREGLPRALRRELEGLNEISAAYTAAKNKAAIDARSAAEAETLGQRGRQVRQAEEARDKLLTETRPDFETRFPNWASWQHVIPIGLGAATGALMGGRGAVADRAAAQRWWEAVRGAQGATRAPARAAAQTQVAAQHAQQWPAPTLGREMSAYAKPAILGGIEGGATANLPEVHDLLLPAQNPQRRAWETYLQTLPADHPDRARAQAIIESLSERNPARERALEYFSDWRRMGARTGVGIAEGAGGAVVGKTLGGLPGPWERNLPRAETEALVQAMEARIAKLAQARERAAATRARNRTQRSGD